MVRLKGKTMVLFGALFLLTKTGCSMERRIDVASPSGQAEESVTESFSGREETGVKGENLHAEAYPWFCKADRRHRRN